MTWAFGDLVPFSFDLIAIDPAWDFETYSDKGEKKSPRAQYDTMSLEEIEGLPVGHLARRDCLLRCWGTVPLMHKQIAIIERWGFTYKSAFFWHKVTKNGKNAIGTGYRVRSMVEPVLIGVVGDPQHKAFPGLFPGERREHSRKPESFFQLVEKCCPRLRFRADIYSRQTREGWANYGIEATKFDAEAA